MVVCIIVVALMAIVNTFTFFVDALANTGGTIVPSLLDFMFGLEIVPGLWWKQYIGLTILFIIQMVIVVGALIGFFVAYKLKKGAIGMGPIKAYALIMILLLGASAVLAFLTIQLSGGEAFSSAGVTLGLGPITYGCLNVSITLVLLFGVLFSRKAPVKHYAGPRPTTRPDRSSFYKSNNPLSDEDAKADLILKYKQMLDDGIITQEDYEKKKKDILSS